MGKSNMIPDSTENKSRRKRKGIPAPTEENSISETDLVPIATQVKAVGETDIVAVASKKKSRRKRKRVPAPAEVKAVGETDVVSLVTKEPNIVGTDLVSASTEERTVAKTDATPASAKEHGMGEMGIVPAPTEEQATDETNPFPAPAEEQAAPEADIISAPTEEKTLAETDVTPASAEEHGMGEMGIVPAPTEEQATDETNPFPAPTEEQPAPEADIISAPAEERTVAETDATPASAEEHGMGEMGIVPAPTEEQAAPEADNISAPTEEKAMGDRDVLPAPSAEKAAVDADFVPVSRGSVVARRGDRSIGAILIDARRLKPEDAEQILRLQREQGLRFGEAATQLGLLTQADIEFALSRQFDYPYLLRGESKVSEELVAAYTPFSPQVEALRALRSQLMLRWFDSDTAHKALAVVSGARQEGRSFIAANLAVVFSQLGERTLLIDADMRNPCQHRLFALDNRAGLSAVLSGRGGPEAVQRIPSLRDLSVLPAGVQPPNPLELLARPLFLQLLQDLAKEFDVILLDSPASAEYADAQTLAIRAGAAVIVARKNVTRIWQVRGVSDTVARASATVVGTVLNDF